MSLFLGSLFCSIDLFVLSTIPHYCDYCSCTVNLAIAQCHLILGLPCGTERSKRQGRMETLNGGIRSKAGDVSGEGLESMGWASWSKSEMPSENLFSELEETSGRWALTC